tara:strand:+ start:231 stop:632 length:402 start_codon:yes stop_codon:yes gene_type:complete
MATLKTNTLTGTSTAGSIAVTGEGNSTTTNLQQGLAKSWILFNGTGTPASRDSFNVTSISDGGTGLYTLNLTNAFNDGNHADVGSNANGMVLTHNNGSVILAGASTSFVNSKNTGGSDFDSEYVSAMLAGDLA